MRAMDLDSAFFRPLLFLGVVAGGGALAGLVAAKLREATIRGRQNP